MEQVRKFVAIFVSVAVLGGLIALLITALAFISIPLLLMLCLVYGCVLHAFLQYRASRQDEFIYLLATAADSGAPLAPAVRAYLRDRPPGGWIWTATLLFFLAPGYYWVWHRHRSYDRRLSRVARQLEEGVPLHVALQSSPGVASRATSLAVAVGESTGRLALSLRRCAPGRIAVVWLEALPRLLYPVGLLLFLGSIGTFWMMYLMPRILRIFDDFGVEISPLTEQLVGVGAWLGEYNLAVALGFHLALVLIVVALISPTVRWYIPGLAWLYRMDVQSQVLKMLAVLIEASKPVPEALNVLAESGAFPGPAVRRLNAVRGAVELGEPLADSLNRGRLLPRRMVPLVRAAERAQNLPWALTELGEVLASRAARRTRWLSLALFQVAVVAVGVLVGLMVIGMFLPLVQLITELA